MFKALNHLQSEEQAFDKNPHSAAGDGCLAKINLIGNVVLVVFTFITLWVIVSMCLGSCQGPVGSVLSFISSLVIVDYQTNIVQTVSVVSLTTRMEEDTIPNIRGFQLCNTLVRRSVVTNLISSDVQQKMMDEMTVKAMMSSLKYNTLNMEADSSAVSKKLQWHLLSKIFHQTMLRNTSNIFSILDGGFYSSVSHSTPAPTTMDIIVNASRMTEEHFSMIASQFDEEDTFLDLSFHKNNDYDSSSFSVGAACNKFKHLHLDRCASPGCFRLLSAVTCPSPHLEKPTPTDEDLSFRMILNSEVFDSFPPTSTEFQLKLLLEFKNGVDDNGDNNILEFPIKMTALPGKETQVDLRICIESLHGNVTKLQTEMIFQESSPLSMLRMDMMDMLIAFGKSGYRLQLVCTHDGVNNAQKRIELERKYPGICDKITAINFAASGSTKIFSSQHIRVSPAYKAIQGYIKDNISIFRVRTVIRRGC